MLNQFFTARRTIFFIGLFLFLYTSYRAYIISFTYDEAYSFLEFVIKPNWLPKIDNYMGANNHLLNTWLMKLCYEFFGMSEFSLRLPNVVAHILYLFFSAKLCSSLFDKQMAVIAFLIININPFLLDFFSLARGYGLSMGLMMPVFYFIYQYIKSNKTKHVFLAILFISAAVLANLSIIYVYLLTITAFLVLPFYLSRASIYVLLTTAVFSSLFLYFLLPYMFALDKAGAFFYGGNHNIFSDTITSLIFSTFYFDGNFYPFLTLTIGILVVVILFLFICSAFKITRYKVKNDADVFFQIVVFILVGVLAGCTVQHIWLNTKLPYDRTAIFFIPLFALAFSIFGAQIKKPLLKKFFIIMPVAASLFFFAHAFNFNYVISWKGNGIVKNVINTLKPEIDKGKLPLSIGIDFTFEPSMAYYKMKNKMDKLNYTFCLDLNKCNQYFLITSLSKQNRFLQEHKTTVLKTFTEFGAILYKNESYNDSPSIVFQYSESFENYNMESARNISTSEFRSGKQSTYCDSLDNYSRGIVMILNDTLVKADALYFSSYFKPENYKHNATLVFSIENAKNETYYWFPINVKIFGSDLVWTHADYLMPFPKNIIKGDVIKIYFWNSVATKLFVDDMKVNFLKY